MNIPRIKALGNEVPCILGFLLMLLLTVSTSAQKQDWHPIASEELRMSKGKVDPATDAEVIFWETYITDDFSSRGGFTTTINTYIRIKIFTERGRELEGRVDIPYARVGGFFESEGSVSDIRARTIKP